MIRPRPGQGLGRGAVRRGRRARAEHGLADVGGEWTDTVDDLTLPGPEDRDGAGVAFTTPIRAFEDLALLGRARLQIALPDVGPVRFHKAIHRFGDTKHRGCATGSGRPPASASISTRPR